MNGKRNTQLQTSDLKDNRMVCVRIILLLFVVLFVCLPSPAASRLQQPVAPESAIDAKPADEGKINIVFCFVGECNNFGHGWQTCYCCGNQYQKKYCHPTMEECRANCPLCNPTCSQPQPPVQSIVE